MLHVARDKAARWHITNWDVMEADIDSALGSLPELDGAVTVNVLYTLRQPRATITRIAQKLKCGGWWYACDLGRVMRLWDWGKYLVTRALLEHGFAETWRLFRATRVVRKQNRLIAELQRSGVFWTHNLTEFEEAFSNSGLAVIQSSADLYRTYNDLVIARRMK